MRANISDDRNYYMIMPRALKYARGRRIDNNALVLYYCIMELQNKNYWTPVYLSERRLCYLANIGHNTFLRCRTLLIRHHLIEGNSDGVNAPRYNIHLAPLVELTELPPIDMHANIYQLPWAQSRKRFNDQRDSALKAEQTAESQRQQQREQQQRSEQAEREQREQNRPPDDDEFDYDDSLSELENLQRLKTKIKPGA